MVGVLAVILSTTAMAEQAPAFVVLPPTQRCTTLDGLAGCEDEVRPARRAKKTKRKDDKPVSVARTLLLEVEFTNYTDYLPALRGPSDGPPRSEDQSPPRRVWVPERVLDIRQMSPVLTMPQMGGVAMPTSSP